MDAKRATAIRAQQMKLAIAAPDEYLKFAFKSSDDLGSWYVLMTGFSGDHDEYVGGEYLVRIELPADFPWSPPDFYFMTPNGLYECEKKVCISIGAYHKEQSRAALKVSTFCNQLLSGLIGWREMGGGISIINTTVAEKKKMAAESHAYNLSHNTAVMKKIDDAYKGYSALWDLKTVPEPMRRKLKLGEFAAK